jgi:hypothetical protein
MHPQLAEIVARFDEAQARLHRLVDALPDERWSARSDPERWSVAECVAHLNLTARAFVPRLTAALDEARALGRPAPSRYRRDAAGWLLSALAGPMPRIGGRRIGRIRTAAAFVPGGDLPREGVMADFDALQAEQVDLVRAADGLPIDRVRITSPFDARMKYSAYSALVVLPRHELRHVEQAEDVWRAAK